MDTFAVLGGDLRATYLAGLLAEDGYRVIAAGFDNADLPGCVTGCTDPRHATAPADCVILPLPVTVDGVTLNAPFSRHTVPLDDILRHLRPDQLIVGGQMSEPLRTRFAEAELTVCDYFEREELKIQNAVPTAEGAIQLAMEELPITLHGAECLITGYGRIARVLTARLIALGAHVTVAARRCQSLAWAGVAGCTAIPLDRLHDAGDFDVIFNTVPALLFDEAYLTSMPKRTLLIDLASRPGGVDFAAAAAHGVKTIWALSLPGRVAPKTAGAILKNAILNVWREREGGA
ncbi:MAG: dipicolinate synthase subunit DpsA [Clostridia bacterium]|nr:dipicolinate synthase subunit DpsA [Clostridia bacterium]